jgi:hypothetical protein
MEPFMWSAIVLPLFVAVVGWFAFNFFAKPLVDFLSLRSQVHEEIIFTGNIDQMVAGEADHLKAFEALRRLGAKVQAMNENISSLRLVFLPLRWFLSKQGYDLRRAGRGLIGLSNSLTDDGRAYETKLIQVALKLPPTD